MKEDEEVFKILEILDENRDKSFVKRILNPEKYPVLDLGNGSYATHKMSWAEAENDDGLPVFRVFPTVLYNGDKLVDQGDKAYGKAVETGNFIDFSTPEEAEWFSTNYKKVWGPKAE